MIVTEEQAKEKLCHSLIAAYHRHCYLLVTADKTYREPEKADFMCTGSKCMAWVWLPYGKAYMYIKDIRNKVDTYTSAIGRNYSAIRDIKMGAIEKVGCCGLVNNTQWEEKE